MWSEVTSCSQQKCENQSQKIYNHDAWNVSDFHWHEQAENSNLSTTWSKHKSEEQHENSEYEMTHQNSKAE